jgi:hypothetical protein
MRPWTEAALKGREARMVDVMDGATTQTLLEMSDVARLLEISYSGLYMIVKAGKLEPAYVTPRGLRLFEPNMIERFRQQREEQKQARLREAVR